MESAIHPYRLASCLVPATPRSVWELVGKPNRHPEWWPEVVEVQGKRFGRGCEYGHVAREGDAVTETTFLIEKVEELKGARGGL
jgi:uncharacterized protein YndB with AHSA1/START domain